MSSVPTAEWLPLAEMRRSVRDLLEPRAWIYWTDFLFHVTLGWAAFAAILWVASPPAKALLYVVCVLSMYRAVIFIHELSHLRQGTFGAFRWTWNFLCGFAVLVPSYTYSGVHNHHHRRNVYGTGADGEYVPFARRSPWLMVALVSAGFLLPALAALRFIVLTPIGWISPRVRRWLWERMSSLTLELSFRRETSERDDRAWPWQEALTFVYGAAALGLALAGVLPWRVLGLWYLMAFGVFTINSVRTLAAHCYRNPRGRVMSVSEQFLDSVDVPGHRLLTALWAPVGLRYHATHHLFPSMPYHNLGKAYRRLARQMPEVYTRASRRSLWDALRRIWREAQASRIQAVG